MASTDRPVLNGLNLNALNYMLVPGATSGGEITVTGITVEDPIIFCLEFAETTSIPTARTATYSSAGKVSTSVDTDGDLLWIFWYDVSATEAG